MERWYISAQLGWPQKAFLYQTQSDQWHVMENSEQWDNIIEPQRKLLDWKLKEVWNYRDLLWMFVVREFVVSYKQTILGPLWLFIQPMLTALMYVLVFGNIAKISTNGQPMVLFYLAGIIPWNYFSNCLAKTSTSFRDNQNILGKVYYPRLITPLSIVSSLLIRNAIETTFFVCILAYYLFIEAAIEPNSHLLLIPFYVLIMAGLGLGIGMLITSLTTKYRDLVFLLQFGVQLLMYASPVIYPVNAIPEKYQLFILLNPMTSIIEGFRYAFLGGDPLPMFWVAYSAVFMLVVLFIGTIVFNKTEQNFMDTV